MKKIYKRKLLFFTITVFLFTTSIISVKAQYYVSIRPGKSFYLWSPDPNSYKSTEVGFNHFLTKSGNYWYLSWNGGGYAGGVTHRSPATCSLTPPCTASWEQNTTQVDLYTYHPWVGPAGTESIIISSGTTIPYSCSSSTLGTRAYVNHAATGANDGSSWMDAFKSLESALQAARTCGVTEIWVAAGTYKPSAPALGISTTNKIYYTFHLVNDVKIYGGFLGGSFPGGGETNINQRIAGINETILSGDHNNDDINLPVLPAGYTASMFTENSMHVLISVNDNSNTLLDNVTVRNGFGASYLPIGYQTVEGNNIYEGSGAGLYNIGGQLKVNNVRFLLNAAIGGAIYNSGGNMDLSNCTFTQNFNSSGSGGGAILNGGTINLNKCVFSENKSRYGGAIFNGSTSNSIIKNTVFKNNTANFGGGSGASNGDGGAIKNFGNSTIENSVFVGNSGSTYSGNSGYDISNHNILNIYNSTFYDNFVSANSSIGNKSTGFVTLVNSIVKANIPFAAPFNGPNFTVNYSNILQTSGIYAGMGNINSDPLFVNPSDPDGADNIWCTADDGFRINSYSASKDAGYNAAVTTLTDIRGINRIENSIVDHGAYEIQTCASLPAPCVIPSGVSSVPPLPGCMAYISVYDPSNMHVETVEYNNGNFSLNPFILVGNYKIVLHSGSTPTLTPSLPCGYVGWTGDSYGGVLDGTANGLITINVSAASTVTLLNTRLNASNEISFALKTSTPLPIKLISFTAKAVENEVQLNWATSSESNSQGFDIERSENGKEFSKIGYVKSEANNGKSNEKLSYYFVDGSPLSENNYYRLKQLDLDRNFEYSAIKSVKMEDSEIVKVYPNPVTDYLNIDVADFNKIKSIQLLDARGSIILNENILKNKIDLRNVSGGIYFLKIEDLQGKYIVKKIMKN